MVKMGKPKFFWQSCSKSQKSKFQIQFQLPMTTDTKRHLANINDSLRAEHNNLKATKDHLVDHINGLIKRQKQLNKIRKELTDQLVHIQEQTKIQQKTKEPLCLFLKEELSQLDKKYIQGNLRLRNLQNQYQNCLLEYEKVIEVVTNLVEGASGTQSELGRLKESEITMKAMIFDCEKLKRVLDQEKRYFRELCHSEEKSHAERIKELESIRKNIRKEEDSSTCSIRLTKLHVGIMKLGAFFSKRITEHRDSFLRPEAKEVKMVKLGVKTLQNCLRIGTLKMLQNKRFMFNRWHSNIFPKSVLRDIAERALIAFEQSRIRIKTLNTMEEQVIEKNTKLLQLFEKIKYMVAISHKYQRKDMHYGFSVWREECRGVKKVSNTLEIAFSKALPKHLKRVYFGKWQKNWEVLKRVEIAGMLLSQYESTKNMARAFRRWRVQLLNIEEKKVRFYMRRLQDQQKITRKLNYEKRKMKILTMLHFKVEKIKLRNYFAKYWYNVKSMMAVDKAKDIQVERQKFSQARKNMLKSQNTYEAKDKNLLLHIFRDFVYNCKIVPVYKQWRNEAQIFKKKKRSLLSLVMRRQAKNKIYVMNQFRKCVQYYQKKQMHQVLTDLNHKMQEINQKSSQFRQSLKNCIQNLGLIASRKLNTVTNYIYQYQKRLIYNTYNAKKIKKAYSLFLVQRFVTVLQNSAGKQVLASIRDYIKDNQKEFEVQKKAAKHFENKIKNRHKRIFMWWRRQAVGHFKGFARLCHAENIFYFYRLVYAFAAIKRVYTAEKYKALEKELENQGSVLNERQENMKNAINTRQGCQKDLRQFFGKFVTYEDRRMKITARRRTHNILGIYLSKMRKNVHNLVSKEKAAQNIGDLFMNNNQMLFFKNLMIIRYEQMMSTVKQELAKINKKRKAFEDKNQKVRIDMLKKFEEELQTYKDCKEFYEFYTKRYEDLLEYYKRRTARNDEMYIKKQIFIEWKYEYVTAKKLIDAIQRVYMRKFMRQPCHLAIGVIKGRINKAKAQDMIALMLQRKGNQLKTNVISLWRVNVDKYKQSDIKKRLDSLDDYEKEIKDEIRDRAYLIAKEVPKISVKKLISKVFMGFKQVWLKAVTERRKVQPMLDKVNQKHKRNAMDSWKWQTYFLKTSQEYVKYKKQKYNYELKRDVFNSFKFRRYTIINLINKSKIINNNQIFKVYHFSFDKIRNDAAHERDQLNYERRKALTTILKYKIGKLNRIKQKILWKWNARLIDRLHYLPSFIKRMELNVLKKAFSNINQKKYWNDIYIRDIAEQFTQDGYNEVNTVTNSLMREGYDPDEIKDYLKKRNDKDMIILDGVIKHFRMWASKGQAVRAFHSWKQYLILKKNIKKAMTKVFNIAGGIGKYWSRWRTKDVHFNQILKKESRGNMLIRFRQLSRLLKQYHRDIRDNNANLQELKDINNEYKEKNKVSIIMGLNVFSNSIKKGMLQGFTIWRSKIHEQRLVQLDQRQEQILSGLDVLVNQKSKLRYNMGILSEENRQLKEKCMWGVQCGKILEKLLTEKDTLSIDLADKQHNLKLLLEDNLRLKQKMKIAKDHAARLIHKVEEEERMEE